MHKSQIAWAALLLWGCSCSSAEQAGGIQDAGGDALADVADAADASMQDVSIDTLMQDGNDDPDGPAADSRSCIPVDSTSPLGPSGFATDGWTWTELGVVLEDPSADAFDGFLGPSLLVTDDTLHMWWTVKVGLAHSIWHATSMDGMTFHAAEPVAGLEGDTVVAYPSVVRVADNYRMFYTSGGIDVAQSDDGVNWTVIGKGALGAGSAGRFDSFTVLYPSVLYENGLYTLYYTGFDGQTHAIGRATSSDGLVFNRTSEDPVLGAGASADFDNRAVAQPCAVSTQDATLLWYGGYDTSETDPGPYRVGLAVAPNGMGLNKRGVTHDLSTDGPQAFSTRDPSVVRFQDRWWMAYVGMGDDNRYRILMAFSDNCL